VHIRIQIKTTLCLAKKKDWCQLYEVSEQEKLMLIKEMKIVVVSEAWEIRKELG
jgi:hypothetical protein